MENTDITKIDFTKIDGKKYKVITRTVTSYIKYNKEEEVNNEKLQIQHIEREKQAIKEELEHKEKELEKKRKVIEDGKNTRISKKW